MCGFAGLMLTNGQSVQESILRKMNDSLSHRGPDESGYHLEPGLGFGHRRLSIIDIVSGQQPLYNEDESVVVVFNGEIYNYRELVKELRSVGHFFKTNSDTEVIVHAWEEWGPRCLERFRGMFAFALWDRSKRSLFLARDRLGIKPLYYGIGADRAILFGSELKALSAYPGFRVDFDPLAIEEYFALGYVPEPRSFYRNTWKLNPGHYLLIQPDAPLPAQVEYWDVEFTENQSANIASLQEDLVHRIREAVSIRLISEVPIGAFLSGGIDSSSVVATMAGLLDEPVNTCSITFPDPDYDEAKYARLVSRQYGTCHREREVNPDDFELVGKLAFLFDEPFADSSAMPTYRVCQLARESVTVALSGDGGDENLAGYRRHRLHMNEEAIRGRLPIGLRKMLFGPLGQMYPKLDWLPQPLRAKTTFQALAKDSVAAYFHSVSINSDDWRNRVFSHNLKRELQGYNAIEVFRRHAAKMHGGSPLGEIQYLDIKTYLPGDILTKVDRASMAHSLEVRVPLLDHLLVEWLASLPAAVKLNGQEGKYLLKKSFERFLPHDVLYRKKMGFVVPLANWFRGPLRERLRSALLEGMITDTGYFAEGQLELLFNNHLSGRVDNSRALWSLLMFSEVLNMQCR